MSGLTIGAICEALKAQLDANLVGRQQNVYAYPVPTPKVPSITIEPDSGDFVDYFQTMGATGLSALRLVLVMNPGPSTDAQSMFIRLYDYLSAGTGNRSSVVDAVMADKSLGGVVDSCTVLRAEVDVDSVTARLPVQILVRKVGAQT